MAYMATCQRRRASIVNPGVNKKIDVRPRGYDMLGAVLVLLCLFFTTTASATLSAPSPQMTKSPLWVTIEALGTSQTQQEKPVDDMWDEILIDPQDTFGTRALNEVIVFFQDIHAETRNLLAGYAPLTDISQWVNRQMTNSRNAAIWQGIADDLLQVVVAAFLLAALLEWALFPLRRRVSQRKPSHYMARVFAALGLLALRVLPVLLFIGLALSFFDESTEPHIVRFVVLSIVYAITLSRLLVVLSRFVYAPKFPGLRLVRLGDRQAISSHLWIRTFGKIVIYGYFLMDVARAVRFPVSAITVFSNLLGLLLVGMTIVLIIQKRIVVSTRLRGGITATKRDLTLPQSMRLWFAKRWHVVAIAYLVIGDLITSIDVDNGFGLMLRGTVITLLMLFVMRVLFHAVNRWGATDSADGLPHILLRFLFRTVIWVAAILIGAVAWGVNVKAAFATPLGQRLLHAGIQIGITVVSVTVVYEIFSALIEYHLTRRDKEDGALKASARARTLLPMIRNTAFLLFTAIIGLVVLSAAGVNIAPLLAGAGVIGVAIGFGAQTLVKDFLNGLFIVLENAIAVGDLVKIGDYMGHVEAISIRTIRLRDENGSLHIMPFNEVGKITNMTRDYVYALADVGVSYDTDLDEAMRVIRDVGAALEKDMDVGHFIRAPIEILGVENIADFSIVLRFRMRTVPGMQREVRRALLLRIKQQFDKEGIEIPYPTTNWIGRKG